MRTNPLNVISFVHIPYGSQDLKEIEIKNVIPEELGYSYKPNYTAQPTLGRMSPIQMYSGGSDIKYSFTLTIHEDMLLGGDMRATDQFENIIEFVDALKALSYPYLDDVGLMRAPNVEFQIGDISGNGFVKVNVAWKKPFRNGRYIMADISFDITATKVYPKVIHLEGVEDPPGETTYLTYNDTVRLSDRETELITSIGTLTGLEIAIGDFIPSDNISEEEKRSNIRFVSDTFDYAQQKFRDLLAQMELMAPDSETVDNLQNQVEELDNLINISISGTASITSFVAGLTTVGMLEKLKTDLVEYIEGEYYTNVNRELLAEERDALVVDITDRIDALIVLYEEVSSYGFTG